jgi:serine/threonine protein kinase
LRPQEAERELAALKVFKEIRGPFLLALQSFHVTDRRLLIVLALADGSLGQRLRQCRDNGLPGIPHDELLLYLREAAEALDFLHARRVLHRDVKPDNLLVLGGHVLVADYGLGRLLEKTTGQSASSVGTPLYMAPEVWQGKVSYASDQYALAVAYAELLTGHYPFPGDNLPAIMYAHLEKEPELHVPEAEAEVLRRALARDPKDRYPSCTAFAAALTAATRTAGTRSPHQPAASRATSRRSPESAAEPMTDAFVPPLAGKTAKPTPTEPLPLPRTPQPLPPSQELEWVRNLRLVKRLLQLLSWHGNVPTLIGLEVLVCFGLVCVVLAIVGNTIAPINTIGSWFVFAGSLACVLGLSFWLERVFWRKIRAKAAQKLAFGIEELAADFPQEVQSWGGSAVLRDKDIVRELLRQLTPGVNKAR